MSAARLLLIVALLTAAAVAGQPGRASANTDNWIRLASLPDRVGFAGMLAGVLGGRLVAAGGSNFPDAPLWLKGEKAFSDRIFVLATPDGAWSESALRLPTPIAHAASAASADAVYFAGGLNATGCLARVWEMRVRGDDYVFTDLPDLPHPIGYGAAAIVGRRFYVAGGLDQPASKHPSREVWSLDLDHAREGAGWRREPDLPGPGVFVTAAASDGESLFVLGGIGFDADGKPIPSRQTYRLAGSADAWQRLPDLPDARVGVSTPVPIVAGRKFFLIGGYAEVFPGAPREHPGFAAQTLYYRLAARRWENGPALPQTPVTDRDAPGDAGPAPMIGAPCVVWRDLVVVVGGEVRASVRTPAVIAWPLRHGSP